MHNSTTNLALRIEISTAVADIVRLFHWEAREFKDPAALVCCEETGMWEIVDKGHRKARSLSKGRYNSLGPHVLEVDRSAFKQPSGGLDELLDLAEIQRSKDIEGKVGIGVRVHLEQRKDMCWAELENMGLMFNSCPLRARKGKLTCELHADYEESAQALLTAVLKVKEG